jgi:DNA-binding Xre family transcriptional regulator
LTNIGSYWKENNRKLNFMSITYKPLWQTMKAKGFTTYDLKHKLKIGGGTYNRLKNNESVSTNTIGMLCDYLDCDVQDIMYWEREIKEPHKD